MPTPSWLGRDSNGILRDFTGEDVDETAMPAEVGGGGEQVVLRQTFTLTDAQIKTLPTTNIDLLTPAEGKAFLLVRGMVRLNKSGGNYTGGGGYLYLRQAGSGFDISNQVSWGNLNTVGQLCSLTPALYENDSLGTLSEYVQDVLDVSAIQVRIIKDPSENLTGGHASNTMKITLLYMEVDV